MSINDGANLDASTFDVDAWIDGVVRPEVTVELYQNEAQYQAEVARIEAQIPAAEKVDPENRGLDDVTVATLAAQLESLAAERSANALKVRVRQLKESEIVKAVGEAMKANEDEIGKEFYCVAAACVEPAFTVPQLRRLYEQSVVGESMVAQLIVAVGNLARQGLPVPSLPER